MANACVQTTAACDGNKLGHMPKVSSGWKYASRFFVPMGLQSDELVCWSMVCVSVCISVCVSVCKSVAFVVCVCVLLVCV